MNPLEFTVTQLKRAAAIKEKIEDLNKELYNILAASVRSGRAPKKRRALTASAKRKIAAAQKARWANYRRAKIATSSVKPAVKPRKRVSAATRAKVSAKMKAYWAAKKAGKK
jgi:hypothetical protein